MNLSYGAPPNASLVEFSRAGDVFCAYSSGPTSLPAYTATALGPILWNGGTLAPPQPYPEKKAFILGISVAITTASAAAVGIGLTWGSQLTTFPVQNTPIVGPPVAATLVSSTYATNKQPSCTAYNSGTVAAAGFGFLPLVTIPTTALTALPVTPVWIPLDGVIVLPVGGWVALASSATATTSVLQYAIVWCESEK